MSTDSSNDYARPEVLVTTEWAEAHLNDPSIRFVEVDATRPLTKPATLVLYGDNNNWFVLHYLLGYPNVRNYDGSWTEWGSSIGVPIEKTYQGQ